MNVHSTVEFQKQLVEKELEKLHERMLEGQLIDYEQLANLAHRWCDLQPLQRFVMLANSDLSVHPISGAF